MRSTVKSLNETYQSEASKKEANTKTKEIKQRLDLNDLLKRIKKQKSDDRRINTLVISVITLVFLTVFLILSL